MWLDHPLVHTTENLNNVHHVLLELETEVIDKKKI